MFLETVDPSDPTKTLPVGANNKVPVADSAVLAALQSLIASQGQLVVQPLGGVLIAGDSGKIYSNEGAAAISPFVLPSAVAGLRYSFVVQDADGVRVTPAAGDTIRVVADLSAIGALGKIESTTIGSVITLVALNATEWVATSALGTWTVTS